MNVWKQVSKHIRGKTNISVASSCRVCSSPGLKSHSIVQNTFELRCLFPSSALCGVLWGSTASKPPAKALWRRSEGCASNPEQVSSSQTTRQGVSYTNKAPHGMSLLLFIEENHYTHDKIWHQSCPGEVHQEIYMLLKKQRDD